MKKIVGLTLGITCLAAALSAQATTNGATLTVIGTIKPAACSLNLTGNGEINYGTIRSGELQPAAFTPLTEKTVGLSILCNAATTFGVTFTDLQSGTRVPGILGAGYTEAQNFGLGAVGTRRTGGYSVALTNLRASNTTLYPIMRSGASWQHSDGKVAHQTQYSWRSASALTPATISQLTGTIAVKAVINKTADLDLKNDVSLNGRATIVLNYT